MKKIINEIVFLGIAVIFGFLIIRGLTADSLKQQSNIHVELKGSVVKNTLMISSPVYGELISIPVSEGEYVKKGEIVAKVKVISHPQDTTLLNTDVFKYQSDELTIINPEDGIVANVIATEKSTISPQTTFLIIYPLKKTTISIYLPLTDTIQHYKNFSVSATSKGKKYALVLKKSYPVKAEQNNQVYFALFKNADDAKLFYADQPSFISAEKIVSKQKNALQVAYTQFVSFIHTLLNPIKK